VAQGVSGRLRLRFFLTFRHYEDGRSSAKRIGRLYLRRNLWYLLSEAESTSGHMVLSGEPRPLVNITHDCTNCCLYTVDPPDDEQQACSKHVEAYY